MLKPQYVQETGFLVDLLFIYVIHYNNSPERLRDFINEDKYDKDLEFYRQIDERFGPYSDSFLPFFYRKEDGINFSTVLFIDNDRFYNGYVFEDMREAFSDTDHVKEELFDFYFHDETLKSVSELSLPEISRKILCSTLPTDVKLQLLAFYTDPESVLRQLVTDLERKAVLLQGYYAEHEAVLESAKQIDWEKMGTDLNNLPNRKIDIMCTNDIKYSICLIRKNFVITNIINNTGIVVIGCDQDSFIKCLLRRKHGFNIQVFCNALSDVRRMQVFDLLLEQDEMYTSEISLKIGMSMTALLYHLDIMMKAGVLEFHTEGRKVIYHICIHSLEQASKYLTEQIEKKRRRQREKMV